MKFFNITLCVVLSSMMVVSVLCWVSAKDGMNNNNNRRENYATHNQAAHLAFQNYGLEQQMDLLNRKMLELQETAKNENKPAPSLIQKILFQQPINSTTGKVCMTGFAFAGVKLVGDKVRSFIAEQADEHIETHKFDKLGRFAWSAGQYALMFYVLSKGTQWAKKSYRDELAKAGLVVDIIGKKAEK